MTESQLKQVPGGNFGCPGLYPPMSTTCVFFVGRSLSSETLLRVSVAVHTLLHKGLVLLEEYHYDIDFQSIPKISSLPTVRIFQSFVLF